MITRSEISTQTALVENSKASKHPQTHRNTLHDTILEDNTFLRDNDDENIDLNLNLDHKPNIGSSQFTPPSIASAIKALQSKIKLLTDQNNALNSTLNLYKTQDHKNHEKTTQNRLEALSLVILDLKQKYSFIAIDFIV